MSKITTKDFRGFKARYHRNGSSGDGFFVCSFLYHGRKRGPGVRLIGVLHPDDPGQRPRSELTAVIDPVDLESAWDGPAFYDALSEALRAASSIPDAVAGAIGPSRQSPLPFPFAALIEETPPVFEECGQCGHYHQEGFTGDCRDDSERFTCEQLDDQYGPNGWENRDLEWQSDARLYNTKR